MQEITFSLFRAAEVPLTPRALTHSQAAASREALPLSKISAQPKFCCTTHLPLPKVHPSTTGIDQFISCDLCFGGHHP